jgi:signal transduction histidine kinase
MKPLSLSTTNIFHLLSRVLDNTAYLFWIYDEADRLVFANARFFSTTGIAADATGKALTELTNDPTITELIKSRLAETRKGSGTKSFNDAVKEKNGTRYYDSNWYMISNDCGNFVAGYAIDVTNKRKQGMEIQKLSSRLSYISINTAEVIWEWETSKNHLHFNDKMSALSGFYMELRQKGISFWLSKVIHPADKLTVLRKIKTCLINGCTSFTLEYCIVTKSGDIKRVADNVQLIYHKKKPVRIFGCIKDITENDALHKEVAANEIEKKRAVNEAYIQAQEQERDWLSKELHDNVNQLILSAKMYISIAKSQPEIADEMLEKAVEYQLMALEESRKLSKNISSNLVEFTGFAASVNSICNNLELTGITVTKRLDAALHDKLNSKQNLMMLRIIQEQSSNIIKYASARNVCLTITERNDIVSFEICDDGVGFKPGRPVEGIGLSNIKSRVTALGGRLSISAKPGKGCKISFSFKISTSRKIHINCFAA